MGYLFSNSTATCYHDTVHAEDKMPADAVAISDEVHAQIVGAHAKGLTCSLDKKGKPSFRPAPLPPGFAWNVHRQSAEMALAESHDLVMAAVEQGNPVPPEVVEYRKQLRAIVAAEDGEPGPLPKRPAL